VKLRSGDFLRGCSSRLARVLPWGKEGILLLGPCAAYAGGIFLSSPLVLVAAGIGTYLYFLAYTEVSWLPAVLLAGSAQALSCALAGLPIPLSAGVVFAALVPVPFIVRVILFTEKMFRLLNSLVQDLAAAKTPEEAAGATVRLLQSLRYYDDPSVLFRDSLSEELVVVAGATHRDPGNRIPRGRGVTWQAYERGEPVWVRDVRKDPNYVALGRDAASEIAVPLCVGGRRYGVLNVELAGSKRFALRDYWLLLLIGSFLSSSLAHIEQRKTLLTSLNLHRESYREERLVRSRLQKRLQEEREAAGEDEPQRAKGRAASLLLDLVGDQGSLQDVGRLCENVVRLARDDLGYANVYILARDAERESGEAGRFRLVSHVGVPQEAYVHTLSLEAPEGIWGRVISTKAPYLCPDVLADPLYRVGNPRIRSELTVPVLCGDSLWGLIDLQSEDADAFTEYDLKTLQFLASHLGVLFENAHHVRRIRHRAEQLRLLHDLVQETALCDSVSSLAGTVVRLIAERLGYGAVSLFRAEDAQGGVSVLASSAYGADDEEANRRLREGRSLTGRSAREGALRNTGDVTEEEDWIPLSPDVRSQLDVPICYQGRVYGVLCLEDRRVRAFSRDEEELFSVLAQHLATTWRLIESFDRIREEALRDPLTGLWNVRYFRARLGEEVARAERVRGVFALLMSDLGDFKAVNDQCGHLFGDEVLRAVGRSISGFLRPYDVLARYGGDEFVLILPEISREETAAMAERIRRSGSDIPFGESRGIRVDVGFALYPEDSSDAAELLRLADEAMYREKRRRKGMDS